MPIHQHQREEISPSCDRTMHSLVDTAIDVNGNPGDDEISNTNVGLNLNSIINASEFNNQNKVNTLSARSSVSNPFKMNPYRQNEDADKSKGIYDRDANSTM